MNINVREITKDDFNTFSHTHILKNMYQTVEYAKLMERNGYKPMFIGGFEDNTIVAGGLILIKNIGTFKYGYSPRGFLIDYSDSERLNDFTKKLQNFLSKKSIVFVKINPEVTYALVNNVGEKQINTNNEYIVDTLESLGYKKLKDNLYFESLLPKYNPIINLVNYNNSILSKNLKNKIDYGSKKGIELVEGSIEDMPKVYNLIKHKRPKPISYFEDYYTIYNEKDMMDLLLLNINNNEYLKTIKEEYEKESEINSEANIQFQKNPGNSTLYDKKMISDKKINDLNNEIAIITDKLQRNILNETFAVALVIKYHNRAYLLISGFDKNFGRINANDILYHKILEKYKNEGYRFFDLNGITGDFSDTNPYKSLNEFKLQFNPSIFEYIGEFDLIINKSVYKFMLNSNLLAKEFNKKDIDLKSENIGDEENITESENEIEM